MATRQVGAAPAGATDAATKGYVDSSKIKYVALIGDGTSTTLTATHNLNSSDLHVSVLSNEATPPTATSVDLPTANTATIVFDRAPLAGSIRLVVLG